MVTTNTKHELNRLFVLVLMPLLIAGLVTAGIESVQLNWNIAVPMSDSVTAARIGADWGACGILAGIAVGVIAAGASAATAGIGGALVISAGAHIAGYMCLFA
jgi:hypothetical protein